MAKKVTIKLAANFERNLEAIEAFLSEAGFSQAYLISHKVQLHVKRAVIAKKPLAASGAWREARQSS